MGCAKGASYQYELQIDIDEGFKRRLRRKLKISLYRRNIKSNIDAIRWNIYHIERKLVEYINMVSTWARH